MREKKAGFFNIAHHDYYESMDSISVSLAKDAIDSIKRSDVKVIGTEKPITGVKEALEQALKIIGADVDCYIIFLSTWIECSIPLAIIKELQHLPVIIWGFPMFELNNSKVQTGSLVGMMALQGALKRIGVNFKRITGFPKNEGIPKEINDYIFASSAKKTLRRTRLGLVGYMSMSMYPASFDHLLMSALIGPEIVHFDTYSIIKEIENVKDENILKFRKRIAALADNKIDNEILQKSAGLYYSFKSFIERYDLDGINVKCQYELSKEFGCTACVPLSLLADKGYSVACEGDVPTQVSMHILHLLSGNNVTYADILDYDENNGYFSSCGFAPFSLAESVCINESVFRHFKGIVTSAVLKPGEVTIARLSEKIGSYELLYSVGLGIDSKLRQKIMPALSIDFKGKIEDNLDRFSSQHLGLVYGNYENRIKDFASLMGEKITLQKI